MITIPSRPGLVPKLRSGPGGRHSHDRSAGFLCPLSRGASPAGGRDRLSALPDRSLVSLRCDSSFLPRT
jgi:hypothetical protein